jgi:hypothetical protein
MYFIKKLRRHTNTIAVEIIAKGKKKGRVVRRREGIPVLSRN